MYQRPLSNIQDEVKIKQIVGHKRSTNWRSPSPASLHTNIADLELADFAQKNNCWDKIQHCWLSCLCRSTNLLIKKNDEKTWYFSLGDLNSTVVLAWKATAHMHEEPPAAGNCEYFLMSTDCADMEWHCLCIVDVTEWMARPFVWESPVEQQLRKSRAARSGRKRFPRSLIAAPTGPPENLLRVCARSGFFDMALTNLRQLAKHLGYEHVPKDANMYDTLKSLISAVLAVDDVQVCRALEKRTYSDAKVNIDEFMELEGAEDVLCKDDADDVNAMKSCMSDATMMKDFKAKLHEDLKILAPLAARNRANKKSPLYNYKGPLAWPADCPVQSEAKRFLPPRATLWRGNAFPGNWQGELRPHKRVYASCAMPGGPNAALRKVLQDLWTLFLHGNGLDREDCPVKGIYTEKQLEADRTT